jgi:predicted ATP-grasp superfamily ATP-dependent carboligase
LNSARVTDHRPTAFVFRDNAAALATCRELGRAGIDVVVLDAERGPASSSRFARFVEAPSYYAEPGAWAAFVREHARTYPAPPVAFPTEDAALLVADRFHGELSSAVRYAYAAPGPASALLDKRRLYAAAGNVGLDVPRWMEPGDDGGAPAPDDSAWIAKPACRYWFDEQGRSIRTFLRITGGSKAIAGDVRDSARRVRAAGFPTIVQERIPGPFEDLFSVGLALDRDGRLLGSFCARKRGEYPEPFGDGLIVEATEARLDLIEGSAALLRSLGYWGICDVEFKRDERDGKYKLLDANPRVWLWLGLGARCGVPLALLAYALANDDAAAIEDALAGARRETRPAWVSPRGAAAFLLNAWRPGRHGWALPLRVAFGALGTIARDLAAFGDPLYLRAEAWSSALRALSRRRAPSDSSGA